jgi:hypothetical protein
LAFVPSAKVPPGTVAAQVNRQLGVPVLLLAEKEDRPNRRPAPSEPPGLRWDPPGAGPDREAAVAAARSALDWEVDWASDRLIGLSDVEYMLARLEAHLPVLVHEALACRSFAVLTRVVRLLAREHVSVRDLSGILEGLLRYRWVGFDPGDRLVFDDRVVLPEGIPRPVADGLPFLLEGARRPLATAPRGSSPALDDAVLILDRRLEQHLERHAIAAAGGWSRSPSSVGGKELPGELAERFRDAVWATGVGRAPILVTTAGARWAAHALLYPEFPAVTVLSRDELGPNAALEVAQTVRFPRRSASGAAAPRTTRLPGPPTPSPDRP